MRESEEQKQIRENLKRDLKYGKDKNLGLEEFLGFMLGIGVVIFSFVAVLLFMGICGVMLI